MTTEAGTVPGPERVADRMAVEDILYLHCRGLDRLDKEAIQASYWQDATVDYGSFKGEASVFAELVVGALGESYALTRHCLSNTLVAFSADSAKAESCVTAAHLLPDATEEMLFYGRYLDKLAKRNGQWKILHRQVVMDWGKRLVVQDERKSEAFTDMSKGAHLDSDPLYPFLNQ